MPEGVNRSMPSYLQRPSLKLKQGYRKVQLTPVPLGYRKVKPTPGPWIPQGYRMEKPGPLGYRKEKPGHQGYRKEKPGPRGYRKVRRTRGPQGYRKVRRTHGPCQRLPSVFPATLYRRKIELRQRPRKGRLDQPHV